MEYSRISEKINLTLFNDAEGKVQHDLTAKQADSLTLREKLNDPNSEKYFIRKKE